MADRSSKENGKSSKKILVYCRSIDTVSEIFVTVKECLGDSAYAGRVVSPENLLVEMFHKCTHESSKARILREFPSQNSTIRCLFATVALGMGIDIPDIDVVTHVGCPKSVISYWQEAGRCARDGRKGLSLILYDNFSASLKTTEKAIADMVKNPENLCLRRQVLQTFEITGESQNAQLSCCEGCEQSPCECMACKCCSACSIKCTCAARFSKDVAYFLS